VVDENYAQSIASFGLFQGFTTQGAARLLERGEVKNCAAGELLFQEGDTAEYVLLVLSGTIQVFVERAGEVLPLTEVGPGAILGELAVLCGIPRSASVRAGEASVVLCWSAPAFRAMLLRYPLLSERIFREALRTLVEKERSLLDSLKPSPIMGQPQE